MKATLLLIVFFSPLLFFSQDYNETLNSIREAEAKSALKLFMRRSGIINFNDDPGKL